MNKEHLCECGENDPDMFYPRRKSMCKKCCSSNVAKRFKHLPPDHKQKNHKQTKEWIKNNPLQFRLTAAYHRAKRKNLEFTIDLKYLETLWTTQNKKCYYSGVPMKTCNEGIYSVSIDRLDSNRGYIPSNIVLCSSIANTMKHTLSVSEFKSVIVSLYEHFIP